MRKLLASVVCIGMAFAVTACGSGKVSDDAIDQFITASNKMAEIKTVNYEIAINTGVNGELTNMNFKGDVDGRSDLSLSSVVDVESYGTTLEGLLKLYLVDGVFYMNMLEEKTAYSMTNYIPMIEALMQSEQTVENVTVEQQKARLKENLSEASINGNTIKFVFNEETLNTAVKELIEKEGEKMGLSNIDMSIKDIQMEAEIVNGFLGNGTLSFNMNTMEDESMTMKFGFKLNNINEDVTVEIPELSEYPEAEDIAKLLGE